MKKPTMAQEETLYVLAQGGYIRVDWITHRASLWDHTGYTSSVVSRSMAAMVREGWIEKHPSRKKTMGDMSDYYIITEAGKAALG